MNEYKIKFFATIHKTMEIDILAENEESARNSFWNNLDYNLAMADVLITSCGNYMEDVEVDIKEVELVYEEDEDDDLSSN